MKNTGNIVGITITARAVIFKTRQLLGLQDIHNGIKAAVWRLQLRSRVDNWGDKRAQSPQKPLAPRPSVHFSNCRQRVGERQIHVTPTDLRSAWFIVGTAERLGRF